MLAEYMLAGNPHRRGHRRRHHNPADFSMRTLTNPMPLLVDAGSGVLGIATPIIVGNLITGFISPTLPMMNQPGIVGSAIRAAVRVGAAMMLDMAIPSNLGMLDKNAFRVGEAIGIGGSFLMDLLGRPLILGPGDQALSFQYLFGGVAPAATAGAGSYFRRQMTGQGSYFRRQMTGTEMGNVNALVPLPRTGTRGVGGGTMMNMGKGVDLFSAF